MTRPSKPWHSPARTSKQYPSPRMPTLICDCNKTMPLQAKTLGTALNQELPLHTMLCRREAGAFQKAIKGSEDEHSILEMGGHEHSSQETRTTEASIRGFWQAYRPLMGL